MQDVRSPYEDYLRSRRAHYMPPANGPILDIGTGTGRTWLYVHRAPAHDLYGVEPDPETRRLAAALNLYKHIAPYLEEAATPNNTKNGFYDTITMMGLLEHLPAYDLASTLSFVNNSGARSIFITVPNARSVHRQIGYETGMIPDIFALAPADHAIGHQHYYDLDNLHEEAKTHLPNYHIQTYGSLGFKPFPHAVMDNYVHLASAFEAWATRYKITGPNQDAGAELWMHLRLQPWA